MLSQDLTPLYWFHDLNHYTALWYEAFRSAVKWLTFVISIVARMWAVNARAI
jgi:hypothetical protein